MAGRHYYNYGHPPPPLHGYPPGPPGYGGYPPHLYPYPVHPPAADEVFVVDNTEQGLQLYGETVQLPWSTFRWVPLCLNQRSIPPGALRVGTDEDGAEIFAGRARHEGDILPAKIIPAKNACIVSWCGEEIQKDQYEVLVPATFTWQFATDGHVPEGAVAAGVTADNEKLYYGRVTHDGVTTPGKIQPSHGLCHYAFEGEERNSNEYEVLVLL